MEGPVFEEVMGQVSGKGNRRRVRRGDGEIGTVENSGEGE